MGIVVGRECHHAPAVRRGVGPRFLRPSVVRKNVLPLCVHPTDPRGEGGVGFHRVCCSARPGRVPGAIPAFSSIKLTLFLIYAVNSSSIDGVARCRRISQLALAAVWDYFPGVPPDAFVTSTPFQRLALQFTLGFMAVDSVVVRTLAFPPFRLVNRIIPCAASLCRW